jgi:hypothetical protein
MKIARRRSIFVLSVSQNSKPNFVITAVQNTAALPKIWLLFYPPGGRRDLLPARPTS